MHTPRNIQSPYTATDFWDKYTSVNPRMALFMKVTPSLSTDVSTIGLTSNTRDMTLPAHSGITFKSAAGLMPSSMQETIGEATALEMMGLYDALLFDRADVIGGKWENARIEIFIACWDNVNLGELVLFSGFLGEFKDMQEYFNAEGRGLISKLSQDVAIVTTRACRVKEFRNAQCGHTASTVTINSITYDISYTGVPSKNNSAKQAVKIDTNYWTGSIIPKDIPPTNYFQNGKITCTSGLNDGLSREISSNAVAGTEMKLSLKRPFPFAIAEFDEFTITAGCNRTVEDCKKYSNIINFRGEPYVPNITTVSKVPSADG